MATFGFDENNPVYRRGYEAGLLAATPRLTLSGELLDRFRAYYKKHPCWGCLHLVFEDGNVDDSTVRFCINLAKEFNDEEGRELALLALEMSKTQRKKLPFLM